MKQFSQTNQKHLVILIFATVFKHKSSFYVYEVHKTLRSFVKKYTIFLQGQSVCNVSFLHFQLVSGHT